MGYLLSRTMLADLFGRKSPRRYLIFARTDTPCRCSRAMSFHSPGATITSRSGRDDCWLEVVGPSRERDGENSRIPDAAFVPERRSL
jgi:hypothetical protein